MGYDELKRAAELAEADQKEMLHRDMARDVAEARRLVRDSTSAHRKLKVGLRIQSGLVYTLIACLVLRFGLDIAGRDALSTMARTAIYLVGGVTFVVIIVLHRLEGFRDSKLRQADELKDKISLRLNQEK